jgi:hypothetical protein
MIIKIKQSVKGLNIALIVPKYNSSILRYCLSSQINQVEDSAQVVGGKINPTSAAARLMVFIM